MTVPPVVGEYAAVVLAALRDILGSRLEGLYLHGSAAMGGWDATRSDVDLLAVCATPLERAEKDSVARKLSGLEAPGAGLELSIVTRHSLAALSARPAFELHVTTGADREVVDGDGHPGDPDLVMHFAVCRERGVAVAGPAPEGVFPAVPRELLARALFQEVAWGLHYAPPRYAVLNACRAWAYAEDGHLLSKAEGGAWAVERGIEPETVKAALAAQSGAEEPGDAAAVARLVAGARAALLRALGGEVIVRLAVIEDAATLAAMRYDFRAAMNAPVEGREAFIARCAEWMAARLGKGSAWRCWVAEAGGLAIGNLWLQLIEKVPNPAPEREEHAYITNVFVDPAARGAGAGGRLLEAALVFCRERGVDSVILWPTDRSRTLYARSGFAEPGDMMELILDSGRDLH